MNYRTIAIIAHVDHGKTTLVDAMLRQSGAFSEREEVVERVMDSNALEKERGITIYAKNTSIHIGGVKVNIVDTPGHADFGSEVERVLRMVDSVLLLVDAAEGPMPQTRFVLRKSLALGLKPIVVLNKIDKPNARPDEALDAVFDLFVELGATSEQLDFTYVYAIAREGIAKRAMSDTSTNLQPLFDIILEHVPPSPADVRAPLRMQPANLAYDAYVGRMGLCRIAEGTVRVGMPITLIALDGSRTQHKVTKLYVSEGLKKVEVPDASAGEVVLVAGIPNITVGETIAEDPNAAPLPAIAIDPPTLAMEFMVNSSPFAGREGTFVTSRQLRERLERELETNVGLHVTFPEHGDVFEVRGRGELHLAVLIETMRREGYELMVGQPRVILREENGQTLEPYEDVVIDVPDAVAGAVIEALGKRKGDLVNLVSANGSTRLEYRIPTRGILGYHLEFMTATRGEGTLSHVFAAYGPHKGDIDRRTTGAMISGEHGTTTAYALDNLQQRGALFVEPGVNVYEGMVVGASAKEEMVVNPAKEKKLSNMRTRGADDPIMLAPPIDMTLERALEWIADDEYVEVTPKSVRIRKRILTEVGRKRETK